MPEKKNIADLTELDLKKIANKGISDQIKELTDAYRKISGKSLKEQAEEFDMDASELSRYRNNAKGTRPSFSRLKAFQAKADELGLDLDFLGQSYERMSRNTEETYSLGEKAIFKKYGISEDFLALIKNMVPDYGEIGLFDEYVSAEYLKLVRKRIDSSLLPKGIEKIENYVFDLQTSKSSLLSYSVDGHDFYLTDIDLKTIKKLQDSILLDIQRQLKLQAFDTRLSIKDEAELSGADNMALARFLHNGYRESIKEMNEEFSYRQYAFLSLVLAYGNCLFGDKESAEEMFSYDNYLLPRLLELENLEIKLDKKDELGEEYESSLKALISELKDIIKAPKEDDHGNS